MRTRTPKSHKRGRKHRTHSTGDGDDGGGSSSYDSGGGGGGGGSEGMSISEGGISIVSAKQRGAKGGGGGYISMVTL